MCALALATSACGRDDSASTAESVVATHSVAAAPPDAARPDIDVSPELAPALPARGRFSIRVSDEGVGVAANEVPLATLLEALGARLDFKVNIAASIAPRIVTLSAADEAIERIIARLLQDTPYTLRFELDETEERTALAALDVGVLKARTRLERKTARREERRELAMNITPAERKAAQLKVQRAEQEKLERQPEYLADLESDHPEQRARGLRGLDTEQPSNFERAADMLINDPDPSVREAAAEALFDSESSATIETLMGALDDPDPEVVLTALDLLAFLGDEALVPRIRDLAENHPDPTVRADARDKADFLSD